MTAKVEMIDLVTGFWDIIDYQYKYSPEALQFEWFDGNLACDCNRSWYLSGIYVPCNVGPNRFAVLSLTIESGSDLTVTGVDYGSIARGDVIIGEETI